MVFSRSTTVCILGVLLLMVALSGCQSASGPVPTVPAPGLEAAGPGGLTERAQAIERPRNSHVTWGLYEVMIDPATCEVEIIPLRGSEWHANVVEFMQKPYPASNLSFAVDVPASDPPNALFAVDVTLRHPFPSLPIFRGFDVRGAFLADGSYISKYDLTAALANPDPAANDARLINADGYMRWFNPTEFNVGPISILKYINAKLGTTYSVSAILNPYKYFSDDFLPVGTKDLSLQEVQIDPNTRGTFSPGSGITRRYLIQFPLVGGSPLFKFTYVIDASYAEPDPGDPTYPVTSYHLSANTQECYKIVCTDDNSTAYYKDDANKGGDLKFELELFDWQALVNSSGVAGEIGSVIVESPTLLENYGGEIDVTDTFKTTAQAGTVTSSVATIEILDVTPTSQNNQVLFFTVTSADPSDYSNPFGAPFPTGRVLASYYMWGAPILPDIINTPPTVGQVAGPAVVDDKMGPQHYTAPVSDPDTGQTLTAMWSVVPTGNAPSYTISGNPDLSVDILWTDYTPDQDYDVNIRVSDGYAQVEGTLLTVSFQHINNPPTVGAVIGPTPVTVANTSANYSAPINDPDLGQPLTILWSVVNNGSPPSFVIPPNGPGNSLNQNWSTYPVGQYDVNVQVDDGVAPPVQGTLLVVTLNNTLPTLGAITGKANPDETDHAAQYDHGALTDPDNGQTFTYMWSLVPNGGPANYNLAPNGPGNSLIIDWCLYPVGMYDMRCRVYDGYGYGYSAIFDITRGLSACSGNAHQDYGDIGTWPTYSYLGYIPDNWPPLEDPIVLDSYMLPRMDMDFWTRGAFAGQGVMQAGNSVLMNFVADNTGISDPAVQYKWRIPGMSFYDADWTDAVGCSPRAVISLDTSPDLDDADGYDDNRLVIATSHHHDRIYILDADVNTPTLPAQLKTTLTDVVGAREIPCMAIDKDDDIWAIVLGSDDQYRLHHWTYILDTNTGGPYYKYEAGDTLDLTAQLGNEIDVYDMVVAFPNNYLYILEAGPVPSRGVIHEVNLNTSPPTYIGSKNNIFSSTLSNLVWDYWDWGTDKNMHEYAYGADLTIDHSGLDGCDPEHCRFEAMGSLTTAGVQVARLDVNLNIMNRQNSQNPVVFLCNGLSSASNEGDRILIGPPYQINDAAVLEYDFNYWAAPASW